MKNRISDYRWERPYISIQVHIVDYLLLILLLLLHPAIAFIRHHRFICETIDYIICFEGKYCNWGTDDIRQQCLLEKPNIKKSKRAIQGNCKEERKKGYRKIGLQEVRINTHRERRTYLLPSQRALGYWGKVILENVCLWDISDLHLILY